MKQIISLLLIIFMLAASSCALMSCAGEQPPTEPPENGTDTPDAVSVIVPPYRDYGRGTVNFDELEYARPDISAISERILAVADVIKSGALPFDDEVKKIEDIEDEYSLVLTMYTLAELGNMKDSTNEFWNNEYEYMSVGYSQFTDAVEAMLVACAESFNRGRFEDEYFGYSLEDYANGELYTERAVELLAKEAELEAEYSAISTASVEINYLGWQGTVDDILENLRSSYGIDSAIYQSSYEDCMKLYYERESEISCELFLELLTVRSLIADELGYGSYTDYAYEAMGHDYTVRDMEELFRGIRESVYPVFSRLYTRVFKGYFHTTKIRELNSTEAINALYGLYGTKDSGLGEAYSYMLQHGLYDISTPATGRFEGSFTTYIEGNSSPYLFVTGGGVLTDYLTLAHEFGHFYDGYVGYGTEASLDLAEISSQGLELLTVRYLSEVLPEDEVQYLEYYEMYSLLDVLLFQGFLSAFEHYVYAIEYDGINRESVNQAVAQASELIFGSPIYSDLSAAIIPHTILYPHYVQSYCTSAVSALEIYFTECEQEGSGTRIYLELIKQSDEQELGYSDTLRASGLTSPFQEGAVRDISDKIHYRILGSHYFREQDNSGTA